VVRRHQPKHLRAEPARPGARPKGIGQPALDAARSSAKQTGPGKTAARGLHFRQAPHAGYIRRRPRHFRPVGTLRTSSTVLATLSLPLAAISMLGLPATISAAGPTRPITDMASPKPVRAATRSGPARITERRATLIGFSHADHPGAPASLRSASDDYLFADAGYPFGGRDDLRGGAAYPFDGTYHPRLSTKKASPTMVKLAAPGSIATFGDATLLGALAGHTRDIVGIASSGYGQGYWAVGSRGGVFSYGNARFLGSLATDHRSRQIAAIAATPSGHGYWLASKDGDVFSFGDAKFYGSLGKDDLSTTVVGIAALPDGRGYWLVTADGGVYTFGDARYYGSLGNTVLKQPVIGIAASPTGHGYWLATAGGGVFSFGDARAHGSLLHQHLTVTAIAASPGPAQGYWLLAAGGSVHGFGAAKDLGSASTGPGVQASALAPTPSGAGYVVVSMGPSATSQHLNFLGNFLVTCYDLSGLTRSGALAGPQSAAVDPGVIPLGTQIYVQGVGVRTADDTGGAIVGDHVDIWEPTFGQCASWGAQQRAVYAVAG
jgi:3D (Asp-Asp-Asp) domain-containing protein